MKPEFVKPGECRPALIAVPRKPATHNDSCPSHAAPAVNVGRPSLIDRSVYGVENRLRQFRRIGRGNIADGKAVVCCVMEEGRVRQKTIFVPGQIDERRDSGPDKGFDLPAGQFVILIPRVFSGKESVLAHPITVFNRSFFRSHTVRNIIFSYVPLTTLSRSFLFVKPGGGKGIWDSRGGASCIIRFRRHCVIRIIVLYLILVYLIKRRLPPTLFPEEQI